MIITTLKTTIVIVIILIGIMSIDKWVLSSQKDVFYQTKQPSEYKATIRGKFTSTKGCMGVVNGALLTDFANKCDEAAKYEGKFVEVTGVIYEHKCRPNVQCFGGPYMKNTDSIKIIEDTTYEENCGDIWNIKSIVVEDNSILIEFNTSSGGFQVVYKRAKDGTIIPLEYGSTFSLEIGENIGWGDGDHAFASIVLKDIKNNTAFVIIGEEHRPPASHQNLAYSKTRRCKIVGKYSPVPKTR